ncbi:Phosphate starvation-inducible protein PhoH, predicted ATPase [hydrothermal vent metagenome]|uniref:PhoH-like protein n=1 Tax=hydrothermal vent metagenome TaxID=652676 RepID=A0A1W1CHQ8_9ZZZZ
MKITLDIKTTEQLANLSGTLDENIILIENSFAVKIIHHDNLFEVKGENPKLAIDVLKELTKLSTQKLINISDVDLSIKQISNKTKTTSIISIRTRRKTIQVSSLNQQNYVKEIDKKDCVFGIGPAGTGKTYLAVAKAVEALEKSLIRRIVLVRPAVEAGENLGFLPGDLTEKVDPYLRPVYDALYEMLGFERVAKLLEKNMIEVAPLAFMRGRTLNESFVILDEAQNTTKEQMKMFLTRLGFNSQMVITGDITQIDLSQPKKSGLIHAMEILEDEKQIAFCYFKNKDVVRHKLVQRIVQAYAK